MYRLPGCPKWQQKFLLEIACFDGEPSAEEIAAATSYKLSSTVPYLSSMARAGLVLVHRHDDEGGFSEITYRLSEAGEELFDEIVTADAALKRLARQRSRPLRAQRRSCAFSDSEDNSAHSSL